MYLILALSLSSLTATARVVLPGQEESQPTMEKIRYIDGPCGHLAVKMNLPPGFTEDSRWPVVIIMHGVMATKDTQPLPFLARKLAQRGFVCVRFDFNAQGGSDGDLLKNTVPSEIDDGEAVYNFFRNKPWAGDISLLGHSQGGVVAAMLAGRLEEKGSPPHSIALASPGISLRDYALEGHFLGVHCDPVNPPEAVRVWWYKFGRDYIKSAQTLPIEAESAKYKGPACIVQGSADRIIPYSDVEKYLSSFRDCRYTRIDGAGHLFLGHKNSLLKTVAEFLKN